MRGRTTYNISYGSSHEGMSQTEKKHLLIAFLALSLAFAIAFAGVGRIMSIQFPFYLGLAGLSVGTAFIFHELAHRKLARRYGCWAEFRMWPWGLMMALLFSLAGFVFAAPGAVMIQGNLTKDQNGRISAAGPATNWLVGLVFILASFSINSIGFSYSSILTFVTAFIAYVNLFIGGFNLLPFGPLDGYKIFSWSTKNYLGLAALIGGTLIGGYYLGPLQLFF